MERESDSKNRIAKAERFLWETTKKLGNSKEVNGNGKRSYEKVVWQKKTKPIRIEGR